MLCNVNNNTLMLCGHAFSFFSAVYSITNCMSVFHMLILLIRVPYRTCVDVLTSRATSLVSSYIFQLQNLQDSRIRIMKRKRSTSSKADSATKSNKSRKQSTGTADEANGFHTFTQTEITELRKLLLQWYDENKRDLPWREMAKRQDLNERAYAVWVSEIMLQQTQVATVVEYYNKWMKKWPKLEDLADATLEEVNEMWAGLGYYSRGRRLHEGAQKVVKELKGQMPRTSAALGKELPGVGRYTGAAIASIAFEEASGVVDGNVIRVFARMCCIGANSTSPAVLESIWSLANQAVDGSRPGDFNQAMMELGATVCTPKTPACSSCPVQTFCKAKAQVDNFKTLSAKRLMGNGCQDTSDDQSLVPDIECAADNCHLCPPQGEPWDSSIGVLNYPRKPKKKPQREEKTAVCVIQRNRASSPEYLIVQRPPTGLLAGLWEFPSIVIKEGMPEKKRQSLMDDYLREELQVDFEDRKQRHFVSDVVHIFSHIHQTYIVETFQVSDNNNVECPADSQKPWRWVTREQFLDSAVSTAMKKVFKVCEPNKKIKTTSGASSKHKPATQSSSGKKQLGLAAFFKPITKEGK